MDNLCEIENCTSPVLAKALCSKHYSRMRRKGSADDARKNAAGPCSIEGCDRLRVGWGLCDTHYRAQYRTQHRGPIEGRLCARCSAPIPPMARVTRQYCTRACKEAAQRESGAGAQRVAKSYYKGRYGLTPDQAERMRAQGCDVCERPDGVGRWGKLHVDHNHETGQVRGVLCTNCNVGLGHFKENPALLRRAADYLEQVI